MDNSAFVSLLCYREPGVVWDSPGRIRTPSICRERLIIVLMRPGSRSCNLFGFNSSWSVLSGLFPDLTLRLRLHLPEPLISPYLSLLSLFSFFFLIDVLEFAPRSL